MMSKIKTYFCALIRKRNFATLLRSGHRSSRSRPRYHWSANWTSTIVTPSLPPLTTTTTKVTGHSLGTMFSSSSPTYQQFTANSATQCSQASRKENVYHKRTQCEQCSNQLFFCILHDTTHWWLLSLTARVFAPQSLPSATHYQL